MPDRPSLESFATSRPPLESFAKPASPVEQSISGRPSYTQRLAGQVGEDITSGQYNLASVSPVGSFGSIENIKETAEIGMNMLGSFGQITEAPLANVALELQKGSDPIDLGVASLTAIGGQVAEPFFKGITGERVGEFGDVYRNAGMPEPLAATMGMITAIALDPTQIKQLPLKGINISKKAIKGISRAWKKGKALTVGGKPKINYVEKGRRIAKRISDDFVNQSEKFSLEAESAINQIQKETDGLLTSLDEFAGQDTIKVQEGMKSLRRQASNSYEQYIKSISKRMNKTGNALRSDEIENVMKVINDDILKNGLDKSSSFDQVLAFTEKYRVGKGGFRTNKPIQLVDFLEDVKIVKNQIQRDLTTGKITPDSLAADWFSKGINEFIDIKAPGWKQMNRKYGQVIALEKKAGDIFKQGKGKYYTEKGEKFLKSIAEDSISQGERAFVDDIQKGVGGFTEGLGDIASREKITQSRIAQNTASIDDIKEFQRIRQKTVTRAKGAALEAQKRKKFGVAGAKALTKQKKQNIIGNVSKRIAQTAMGVALYGTLRGDMKNILGGDSGGGGNDTQ